MSRCLPIILITIASSMVLAAGPVLDDMDDIRFQIPKEKGKAELVEGKVGKAVRFTFDKDARGIFFTRALHGQAEWDKAAGISFLVKGDGSDSFGGLEFIYDDDYAIRYDFCFPIKSTEWTRITVAWGDFVPVLPGAKSIPLGLPNGNAPSKISALWVGKWWYWRDYPACSFAIDDIRLEEKIERDDKEYRPEEAPLSRVAAKLKAGKPVTLVTMGDSLTDVQHWANRDVSWPVLLKKRLEEKYGSQVTLVNPAIGGTQLRQNLVLLPRWLAQAPEPDLVTICFGGNDWDAGMRGPQFQSSNEDAIDRVRRATKGKADVLLLSTVPSVEMWMTRSELGEACRKAAKSKNAGLGDAEKAFLDAGNKDRERLFVRDKVHLSPAGHELMVQTVMDAIDKAGR